MKKLALALAASTLAISATQANMGAPISTGPYLGAAVGYASSWGKYSIPANGVGGLPVSGSLDAGNGAANIGIHGGYGVVNGCLYYGGELAYTFENMKVSDNLNSAAFPNSGPSQLKRTGYFNIAFRGGYLIVPASMVYVRLGITWGKWSFNDGNFYIGPFHSTGPGNGSKSRLSFAPGIGTETALTKNLYFRLEYVYEFGPTVTAENSIVPNTTTKFGPIKSHSGKVGLSYKF